MYTASKEKYDAAVTQVQLSHEFVFVVLFS
jgi:hypothetical protein